jgi:hypothetical protein
MSDAMLKSGTLKGPQGHNYSRVYAHYLGPIRWSLNKLLEIGIFRGESVRMWEMYFSRPEVDLHFIDINPGKIGYNSTRSHYHFMSQIDKPKLRELGQQFGPFDVIIDDAGHFSEQIISSFQSLFEFVKPGNLFLTIIGILTRKNTTFYLLFSRNYSCKLLIFHKLEH